MTKKDIGKNSSSSKVTGEHKVAAELEQTAARLQAVVDNVVDAIITIDEQGNIGCFNHAAEQIFGYKESEVIGKNVKLLMPEPYHSEHDGYLTNYAKTGEAKIIGIGREVIAQRKDGSVFPIDLAVSEVKIDHTKLYTGIVRDITERRKTENDLFMAKEEAEKANRAKSDFLSRMSHELRTPLNAIVGFSQLIEMEDLTPAIRESVKHIRIAGMHLTDLINEVLDIARIESGRQNLSPEPVHVRKMLEDTWHLIRPLGDERDIYLKGDIPEECNIYVNADLQRLKQVLLNLLSNAIKYNHDGGTVSLSCVGTHDGLVRIAVSDTGPGIAPENHERIFEPFERLSAEKSEVEGTGLGLALCKALIEAMNGKLDFDSIPGIGSTFWIELPLIEEPAEKSHGLKEPLEVSEPRGGKAARPATLLYIEDNIDSYRLVEKSLSRRPHITLIAAMQGKLGIDLALKHKPDLILLDLNLPDLHGHEVLVRLRSHPATRDIPVVIISADATLRQIDKLLSTGARSYLTKPFNIKELLHVVDTILD